MRRLLPLLLALLVGATTARSEEPLNLFPNGSMTEGDAIPAGWRQSWTGSGKLQLARDTETFRSAPAALRLSSAGGPAKGGAGHVLDVKIPTFVLGGAIKAEGTLKNAVAAVQVLGEGGRQIAWLNLVGLIGPADWKTFAVKVRLPAETRSAQCVITLEGEGQVWLDDLTLVPLEGDARVAAPSTPAPALPDPVARPATAPLPVAVAPNDPALVYEGRWDTRDVAGPRCSWSASMVHLRFEGTALNVWLQETGADEYEVLIDDQPQPKLVPGKGSGLFRLFAGAAGPHRLTLCKRTEAFVGVGQILGFQLAAGGKLLPPGPRPSHRLEVIGDSISCGYGNEGRDQNVHFSPSTENGWLAYGAVAARALGAEYLCVAWSGKKMAPDNTIGELYDRTLALDSGSRWDFAKWIPDTVVITLGTNDFGKSPPAAQPWCDGYKAFVARLRTHYPQARIVCASSPMLSGEKNRLHREYLQQIVADLQAAGDARVQYLQFQTQDGRHGIGADWHPSVKTDQIMADALVKAISVQP